MVNAAKQLTWRLEFLFMRLLQIAIQPLPPQVVWAVGAGFGTLFYYLSSSYRTLSLRNLRIALGETKHLKELKQLNRESFQKTFANFISAAHTALRNTPQVSRQISLGKGFENFYAAVAKEEGVILVLSHMGNWETLNRLHHLLPPGTRAGGIYQPIKNPHLNQQLLEMRTQDGSQMFSKREGFHAPATFLREGGLLIVVADQRVGRAGIPMKFFGRLTSLSPLPALLARKAKARVFAAGISTHACAQWTLDFEEVPQGHHPNAIANALENRISQAPADYLWMHDRWRISERTPLSLPTKKSANFSVQTTKPLRILVLSKHPVDLNQIKKLIEKAETELLPLTFEKLLIDESATPEQLAGQLRQRDEEGTAPIELILLLEQNQLAEKAITLSKIPKYLSPREGENLSSFLARLTHNPYRRQPS